MVLDGSKSSWSVGVCTSAVVSRTMRLIGWAKRTTRAAATQSDFAFADRYDQRAVVGDAVDGDVAAPGPRNTAEPAGQPMTTTQLVSVTELASAPSATASRCCWTPSRCAAAAPVGWSCTTAHATVTG